MTPPRPKADLRTRPALRVPLAVAAALAIGTTAAGCAGTATSQRSASTPQTCDERTTPIQNGLTEARRSVSGRVMTLTLTSRAMAGDQAVNILLPERFDASGRTRYPVLYLLHGAGSDHSNWISSYDIQKLLGDLPVIAVMPDGAATDVTGKRVTGGYTDWFGVPFKTPGPAPAWESYHIRELVPFIDTHLPTRADAAGRAITASRWAAAAP